MSNQEKTLVKILRSGIYLILILTPLLVWSSYIFPYITTKTLFFRTVVALMLPFYFYLIYKYPHYRPQKSWLLNFILIFGAVILVTSLLGINVLKSLYGDLERMWGVLTVWHVIFFFLMLSSLFKTGKDWLKLFKISSIVATLVALYGFAQKFGVSFIIRSGVARIESTLGNAAFVGGYFLVMMGITIYLLWQYYKEHKKINWPYLGYLLCQFFGFALAGIRGAYLAFIFAIIIFIFLSIINFKKLKIRLLFLGIFVVLAAVYFFIYFNRFQPWVNESTYLSRLTSITSLSTNTVRTRFISWQAGLNGFSQTPLTGVGMENYNLYFDRYVPAKLYTYSRTETWFDRAHNAVVEVLVANGILGIISYLGIFALLLYYLFKIYQKDKATNFTICLLFALTILAYFIQNLFVFDTLIVFMLFILFTAFINNLYLKSQSTLVGEIKDKILPDKPKNKFIPLSLIFIALIISIYSLVINYKMSKIAYLNADSQYLILKTHDFKTANEKIKNIFAVDSQLDYFNNKSAALLTDALISNLESTQGNPYLVDSLKITLGKLEADVDKYPGEVFSLVVLGRTYNMLASYYSDKSPESAQEYLQNAEKYLLAAKELSPGRLQVYYLLAQKEMLSNNFKAAEDYLNQAINLNPDFPDNYWFMGVLYTNYDKISEAMSYFNQALDKNYSLSSVEQAKMVINYAAQIKDYKIITRFYLLIIGLEPNNPEYYANLAVTYAVLGEKDQAIEYARKAADIDPSYQSELAQFIKQVEEGTFTINNQ